MTLTTLNTQNSGTGNGVNLDFDFTFQVFSTADLLVTVNGLSKVNGTDYTVTLNTSGVGGTVSFVIPPGDGYAVSLTRLLPLSQTVKIPVENEIPSTLLERMLDRVTALVQQVSSAISRSFTLDPANTNPPSLTIPNPVANEYLGWNATADALVNLAGGGGTTIIQGSGIVIPAGQQNNFPRVNGGGTDFAYRTPAQVATDINVGKYVLNPAPNTTPPTPSAGLIWWDTITNIVYQRDPANTVWNALWKVGGGLVPLNWADGPPPVWISASTVNIPKGFQCNDSTNFYPIVFGTDASVVLSASGVNGLQASYTETIDKTYHLYAIGDSTGANAAGGFFSEINEKVSGTITLPSGYNLKRQLNCVRNDHSSNLIPFIIGGGWPGLYWTDYITDYTDFVGPVLGATNVVNAGTADGSFHTVANSGFISPNATIARLNVYGDYTGTARSIYIKQTGSGLASGFSIRTNVAEVFPQVIREQPLDASQQFDYKIAGTGTTLYVDVMGYAQRL